jgi:hypothetical protein
VSPEGHKTAATGETWGLISNDRLQRQTQKLRRILTAHKKSPAAWTGLYRC